MVTRDIETRDDILLLLHSFYGKVRSDETIGEIFTKIVPIDWDHHIPLIADFWETILLDNPVYKRNAMEKHFEIHKIYPLKKTHFDAWLTLFNDTLDELFTGPVTALAKKRAASVAGLMQLKMDENQQI